MVGINFVRVVIGNEPRVYREVLAGALREMRPHFEIHVLDPEDLDSHLQGLEPHIVICSTLTPGIEAASRAWIVLYPGGKRCVICSIAGKHSTSDGIDFESLLQLADEAGTQVELGA